MCFTSSHHLTRIKATQTVYCQSMQSRDNVVHVPMMELLSHTNKIITTQVKTQENLNVDFVEILIKEQESYTY